MKQHILPAIKLTLVSILVFMVFYPLIILMLAIIAPAKGEGETISVNGKVVGYTLDGQSFTKDNYFQNRPSSVNYNAAGSGASNKAPSNPDYLKEVKARIDSFLVHNPGIPRSSVPAELVTASGSGVDPDISPEAAYVQVKRVAAARKLAEEQVNRLVAMHIEQPLMGILGVSRVNVLKLNVALDKLFIKDNAVPVSGNTFLSTALAISF